MGCKFQLCLKCYIMVSALQNKDLIVELKEEPQNF